mgnify:CR=1 FL=1
MAGQSGRTPKATDDGRNVLALEREAVSLVDLMPDEPEAAGLLATGGVTDYAPA